MDTKQPEALRLAHIFEHPLPPEWSDMVAATKELRRLHDLLGKANALCRIRAARIAELEARMEVDARHPYDGIDCRDATIAELQAGYDAARLEIASLHTQMEAVGAGGMEPLRKREYPPLVCDYCGALTPDPWHSSGMLHGKMSKHIHSCDACAAQGAAQVQAMLAAAPRNATLYDPDDVAFPVQRSADGTDAPTELASIAAAEVAAPSGAAREPLTDEQIDEIHLANSDAYERGDVEYESHGFARAIEHHHGITAAQKGGQHGTE